jgi:hypothetical protein
MNYKIILKRGQSRKVQERLFELGWRWSSGLSVPSYLSAPILLIEENKNLQRIENIEDFNKMIKERVKNSPFFLYKLITFEEFNQIFKEKNMEKKKNYILSIKNHLLLKFAINKIKDLGFKQDSNQKEFKIKSKYPIYLIFDFNKKTYILSEKKDKIKNQSREELTFEQFKTLFENINKIKIEEPDIVREATYTINMEVYKDGTSSLLKRNDGFNIYELLGVLNIAEEDLFKQIRGEKLKIDTIKREIVEGIK